MKLYSVRPMDLHGECAECDFPTAGPKCERVYLASDSEAAVGQARREGYEAGISEGLKRIWERVPEAVKEERERIVRELRENYSVSAANWVEKYMDEFRPAPEPKRLERIVIPSGEIRADTHMLLQIVSCLNDLVEAENDRRGKV